MTSFPPQAWSVRVLQDMENIDCSLVDGDNLTMEALVAVRPAGGEEGNFRFTLAGPDMLKLSFPVSKILAGDAFTNMVAEVEMKPGDQIRLEKELGVHYMVGFRGPGALPGHRHHRRERQGHGG